MSHDDSRTLLAEAARALGEEGHSAELELRWHGAWGNAGSGILLPADEATEYASAAAYRAAHPLKAFRFQVANVLCLSLSLV
jgi:hypothetical protein